MLTRKRTLRAILALFPCLSLIFLMGGPAYAQVTGTVGELVTEGQGIAAGSGPIEVFGISLVEPSGTAELTSVTVRVDDSGILPNDGRNEIFGSDFLSFELWQDTPGEEPITRNGVFDSPHNVSFTGFAQDFQIGVAVVPGSEKAPFSVIIPTNMAGGPVYVPSVDADDDAGDDFYVIIRTSQDMDSDPDDPGGERHVDDFFMTIFALGVSVDGVGVIPSVDDEDVVTETIACETTALDVRPVAMTRSDIDTYFLMHPGGDFADSVVGRYLYHIMGQSIRPRFAGELDEFTGISRKSFEQFEFGPGFEQPVVETLERRQAVIGIDIASGTEDNPEYLDTLALTFTNYAENLLSNSFTEFKPDRDLDTVRCDCGVANDPFFSGITLYHDSNNDGLYTEPDRDPLTLEFDLSTGDRPVDFGFGPYQINSARSHYLLELDLDQFQEEAKLESIADEMPDYFVVIRPDSGDEDDSPYAGDGTTINFGADFAVSLEREETGIDLNLDGMVQPSPLTLVGDGDPGNQMAITGIENALFDRFGLKKVRELGAVAKVQDLHFDWGFDVAENFPPGGGLPWVKIPQTIDATSPPTALLALNIALSDIPELRVIDNPKYLSEIRVNFSGSGFNPEDIGDILLVRDDKSPSSNLPRQIGVFDTFDDLLNLPFPEGTAFDPTNPEENSPIKLWPIEWVQDGPEAWHVTLSPMLRPRLYPHDDLESLESIDDPLDNFILVESPLIPGQQIPRDIVFSGADFFVAVMTSDTIGYGDRIALNIPYNGLAFSSGVTTVDTTQGVFNPEMPPWLLQEIGGAEARSVRANVPVKLTSLVSEGQGILAGSSYTPVIGINMYTNRPPASQGGVDVYFEQLMLTILQYGTRDSINLAQFGGDFLPFEDVNELNTANSGFQIYRDANGNGTFDPPGSSSPDTLVIYDATPGLGANPSRFGTIGDENDQILMIFSSPQNRQLVPPTDTGSDSGDDFFVVLRTSLAFDYLTDNFSVAIISWGPDSIFAPAPHTVDAIGDTPYDALNVHQAFPNTRRGIGFVDSTGIRTRSHETINTSVLNAAFATQLDPIEDLKAEFIDDEENFSAHMVTLSWLDTNGNEDEFGVINRPNEDGYFVEGEIFGVWMPVEGSPFGDDIKGPDGIMTVTVIVPTSFAGDVVKFRIFPYTETLLFTGAPPFNGPGPITIFKVTFGDSPLPGDPSSGGGGGGGGCFIATAAYGTDSSDDVMTLRRFRDERLLETATGSALVKLYYKLSPPLAAFIAERPLLRKVTRTGIAPAVALASASLAATPAQRAFVWTVFGVMLLSACLTLGSRRKRSAQRIRDE